jgi:hypothetical protein
MLIAVLTWINEQSWTPPLSAEEVDAALKKTVAYRPPGSQSGRYLAFHGRFALPIAATAFCCPLRTGCVN